MYTNTNSNVVCSLKRKPTTSKMNKHIPMNGYNDEKRCDQQQRKQQQKQQQRKKRPRQQQSQQHIGTAIRYYCSRNNTITTPCWIILITICLYGCSILLITTTTTTTTSTTTTTTTTTTLDDNPVQQVTTRNRFWQKPITSTTHFFDKYNTQFQQEHQQQLDDKIETNNIAGISVSNSNSNDRRTSSFWNFFDTSKSKSSNNEHNPAINNEYNENNVIIDADDNYDIDYDDDTLTILHKKLLADKKKEKELSTRMNQTTTTKSILVGKLQVNDTLTNRKPIQGQKQHISLWFWDRHKVTPNNDKNKQKQSQSQSQQPKVLQNLQLQNSNQSSSVHNHSNDQQDQQDQQQQQHQEKHHEEDSRSNNDNQHQHRASQILHCQDTVIGFVINATDSKDECDGLIRAYDQTCRPTTSTSSSSNHPVQQTQNQHHRRTQEFVFPYHNVQQSGTSSSSGRRQSSTSGVSRYHLLLYQSLNKFQLKYGKSIHAFWYQHVRLLNRIGKWFKETVVVVSELDNVANQNDTNCSIENNDIDDLVSNIKNNDNTNIDDFFLYQPIDTVIEQQWDDIQYMVTNKLDHIVYESTERHFNQRWQQIAWMMNKFDNTTTSRNPYETQYTNQDYAELNNYAIPIIQQYFNHRRLEGVEEDSSSSDITSTLESSDRRKNQQEDDYYEFLEEAAHESNNKISNSNSNSNNNYKNTNSKDEQTNDNDNVDEPESISIPTKSEHLTVQTAEDAVLLDQLDNESNTYRTNTTTAGSLSTEDDLIVREKSNVQSTINQLKLNSTTTTKSVTTLPPIVVTRTCCASILNAYHELCNTDDEEEMSDSRLVFCILIVACCGIIKSLIRHFNIVWLPEAAGCIVVGVASGYVLNFFPHHDVSFDEEWFLRILVPPIIFEAALSIDKRAFNRHIIPIVIFSVIGTVFATILTASIVHYTTVTLGPHLCPTIPMVEALTFGALISSIDPIAVLSVLSSMGITDTETIYVLIFGESLLNDGVAIVLFHTLVHFLDEDLVIDEEAIITGTVQFFAVAVGSLTFGIVAGSLCTLYFWLFHGCQTALVEVIMFFCWALLPYYICDGIGWSGIVAAVAVGFVMDIYILGDGPGKHSRQNTTKDTSDGPSDEHIYERLSTASNRRKLTTFQRSIFSSTGHLCPEARNHIGFVLEIISTSMETAIFAYLGFFMFSYRYHWNGYLITIAIVACLLSRAIMVPTMSYLSNWLASIQQNKHSICAFCFEPVGHALRPRSSSYGITNNSSQSQTGTYIDSSMKIALWFAGLRGAMSFALVEHVPLYDSFSGHGTRLKPELKAMTSASIMFTVFLLGGSTYYIMKHLGIDPNSEKDFKIDEMDPTIISTFTRKQTISTHDDEDYSDEYDDAGDDKSESGIGLIEL